MKTRDPEATLSRLLEVGQAEIHLRGFRGASIDTILSRASLTKGAFFHYFSSKAEFGYAVVDEIISDMIAAQWVDPLRRSSDPLETIATEFERGAAVLRDQRPILGCPLNNLAQEMSPLDEGFRRRTNAVFDIWHAAYRDALARAQADGLLTREVAVDDAAHALVAQIEGTLSLARNSQDPGTLDTGARSLRRYLDSLRRPAA
jgi:TetR/AcrR family transcriptional regulator, transcriptional repressor for nem operon